MPSAIKIAVMKTLAYADIFDYPLKVEELWKWLIKFQIPIRQLADQIYSNGQNSRPEADRPLDEKLIKKKGGFFFLKDRENIVKLRTQREKWSKEKIEAARQLAPFFKWIPSIKLVGITGALAIKNAKENDDIDLLIITSSGLLWTTRLLVTVLTDVLGKRRHPQERFVNNKICLNMFMDEDYLTISKTEQDLFSAHEVAQMRFLYNKDQTYEKFLGANLWVRKYLPNSMSVKRKALSVKYKRESLFHCSIVKLLNFVEGLLKNFQLWHMHKRRTTEKISDGIIRFHPQDAREWILEAYQKKLLQYSP